MFPELHRNNYTDIIHAEGFPFVIIILCCLLTLIQTLILGVSLLAFAWRHLFTYFVITKFLVFQVHNLKRSTMAKDADKL